MKPEQLVFGISPNKDNDVTDILLGIGESCWNYIKDGHTQTINLTKLGLPFRLIVCGGKDQEQILLWINKHNESIGIKKLQDRRGEDFSI